MVVNCPCVPDEAAPGPFGVVFLWLLGMADPHQGHRESEQTGRGVTARCPRLLWQQGSANTVLLGVTAAMG